LRVDLVIFGLTPVDGFHVKRMPEDKRQPFAGTQVSKPIPGEDAFNTDDQIFPVGRNGLEERFWGGVHIPVEQNLSVLVQDAEIHGARMQVDATIKLVLFGVESHEVSSSFACLR
jgi:hypothetical protein